MNIERKIVVTPEAEKASYLQDALATATALEKGQAAPEEPKSEAELATGAPPVVEQAEPAVEESEEAEAPPPAAAEKKAEDPALEKSFSKLAERTAALRKREVQVSQFEEASKLLRPEQLQAIARAAAKGDALSAMAALGFNYSDVAKAVVGQSKAKEAPMPEKAEEGAAQGSPEIVALKAKVAELEADRVERAKQTVVSSFAAELTRQAEKYPHLAMLEDGATKVLRHIERYHQETGTSPGETPQESFEIAAEAVEKLAAKEAARWEKVLSGLRAKRDGVKKVDSSAPESPTSRESQGQKTLTNKATAASAAGTKDPFNKEALYTELLEDKTLWR